jgi:hypothetical protein
MKKLTLLDLNRFICPDDAVSLVSGVLVSPQSEELLKASACPFT